MPYGDADPRDPNVLVGVQLDGEEDDVRRMAEAFVDEFARLGYDRERILALFRSPHYSGAHLAWTSLGEAAIRRLVDDSVAFWGRFRCRVRDAGAGS